MTRRVALLRRAVWALAMALLLAVGGGLTQVGAAWAARPSYLQVTLGLQGADVVVRGVLYNQQSQPIRGQQVVIEVTPGPAAMVRSGDDGWFTHHVRPEPASTGVVRVRASFAGGGGYSPTQAEASISYQGIVPADQPSVTPTADAESPSPTPTAEVTAGASTSTKITATIDVTDPDPGQVVHFRGTLTNAEDHPISDAAIVVRVGDQAVGPTTVTATDGTFVAMAQVPEKQAPGPIQFDIVFEGDQQLASSQVGVKATVPKPETPTPEPSATPTASTTPTESVSTSEPEGETITPLARQDAGPTGDHQTLVLGALALVVLLGLLTGVALLARTRARKAADDDRIRFISDDE